MPKFESKSDWL